MKKYSIRFTRNAERDVADVATYLLHTDSPDLALTFIDELSSRISTLERFPKRGNVPRELEDVGSHDVRQVYIRDYRIIYVVSETTVFVVAVIDGRRDVRSILQKRFLVE